MSGRACREKEPEGKDEDPKTWYSSMYHFWLLEAYQLKLCHLIFLLALQSISALAKLFWFLDTLAHM